MNILKLIHSDSDLAEFVNQADTVSITIESDGGVIIRRDDIEEAAILAYDDIDELISYLMHVRRYAARRKWVTQYQQLISRVAHA